MKNTILLCLLICTSFSSISVISNFKQRAIFFFTPAVAAYSYNWLTILAHPGMNPHAVKKWFWYHNPALFFGFQGLTYYCWSRAFERSSDDDEPYIHVTVLRDR